jgi:Pathogenicity locus
MQMPGVGIQTARDLWSLGIHTISDLKDSSPESLYEQLCELQNCHVDKCMLYVFRCAVYYASQDKHDTEKLNWWFWKD